MHYVYAIGAADGPTKVGMTSQPLNRVAALQHANAELLAHRFFAADERSTALAIERAVHEELKSTHRSGEWFSIPLHDAAAAICSAAARLGRKIAEISISKPPRVGRTREPRGVTVATCMSPDLKEQIEALAAEDDVSLSKWLERAAKEAAERRKRPN
jgi:hypothetical protein